ncbi:hypothetical protein TCAL_08612 [Tigriopus californicus]|uniref:Protein kinase domain-containing protein n=2 Tax=Tigriopus californicus TaxID=6832 RepID=A0A553PLS7_TIGCA|nr:hypothetical protein TCAL_08612 [Tigriopus californicus]
MSKKFETCLRFLDYRKAISNENQTLSCKHSGRGPGTCLVSFAASGKGLKVEITKWIEEGHYTISCHGKRRTLVANITFKVRRPSNALIIIISVVSSVLFMGISLVGLCWGKRKCIWNERKYPNTQEPLVPYLEGTIITMDSMEHNPNFDELEYDWPDWILAAPDLLRVNMKSIQKQDELGHGHYGVVYNGSVNIQSLSCPVAIKELKTGLSQDEILNEAEKLWRVRDHGHIVALQCVSKESVEGGAYRYALVMSLESKMNLAKYLRTYEHLLNFQEQKLVSWMYQVSDGLDYLRRHQIVHFDLAARNILLTLSSEIAKISDFGLAKFAHEIPALSQKKTDMMLPVDRLPLEVIHNISEASASTDVWSFGILLWEVFSFGSRPYDWEFHHSSASSSSYSRVTSGLINQSESHARFNFIQAFLSSGSRLSSPWDRRSNTFLPNHQDLYRIMLECWHANPLERPFADEIRTQISAHLVKGAKAAHEMSVAREKDDYMLMKKQLEKEARRIRNHTQ